MTAWNLKRCVVSATIILRGRNRVRSLYEPIMKARLLLLNALKLQRNGMLFMTIFTKRLQIILRIEHGENERAVIDYLSLAFWVARAVC